MYHLVDVLPFFLPHTSECQRAKGPLTKGSPKQKRRLRDEAHSDVAGRSDGYGFGDGQRGGVGRHGAVPGRG